MNDRIIDNERIKQLLERRREGFTNLMKSDILSQIEQKKDDQLEGEEKTTLQIGREQVVSYEDRTRYNLFISSENVEFLKRYAFTKGSKLLRLYTMAEAIDDAIDNLRVHYNEPLLDLPEYKKNKKKTKRP